MLEGAAGPRACTLNPYTRNAQNLWSQGLFILIKTKNSKQLLFRWVISIFTTLEIKAVLKRGAAEEEQ